MKYRFMQKNPLKQVSLVSDVSNNRNADPYFGEVPYRL